MRPGLMSGAGDIEHGDVQDKFEEKWGSSMVQRLNDEAAVCRNEKAAASKRSLEEAKVPPPPSFIKSSINSSHCHL